MKRTLPVIFSMLLSITLIVSLGACTNNDRSATSSVETSSSQVEDNMSDISTPAPEINQVEGESEPEIMETVLVAYYSHSSNTFEVANQIHALVGGDLIQITTAEPYPNNYEEHIAQVREEIDSGYLPILDNLPETLDSYEVIYLGYPIWYRDIALPVKAFLEESDLTGKIIIPFCTHEGTGAEESMESLNTLLPNSTILELFDYDTYNRGAAGAQSEVAAWLDRLGVLEDVD